ncbi:MAG: RNA polymerase sigma factor [Vicinamibacterales bacterium]
MTSAALELLYRAQHGPLVRYLAHETGDRDAAEDLAHEAFLRVATGEQVASPRAWLFRIATNLLQDSRRHASRRRRLASVVALKGPIADPPASPDRSAEQADLRDRVARLLVDLPPATRRILDLVLADYDHDMIAHATGLARAGVPTTVSRARAQLRARAGHLVERRAA